MAGEERATIGDILANGQVYAGTTAGTSMLPLIHEASDIVMIVPCTVDDLRPMDIVLYRSGETYVLHRMLDKTACGIHALGDNCDDIEEVAAEEVLGVVEGLFRADSSKNVLDAFWYRCYVLLRCRPWKLRLILRSSKRNVWIWAERLGII